MEQCDVPNPDLRPDNPEDFKKGGRRHHRPDRYRGARLSVYWCCMVLLNILLAVFALYMMAYCLELDWRFLNVATVETIAKAVFQLLLVFSPVILTILLNRLLFKIIRGHRRFPMGTGLLAVVVAVAVQALVIYLLMRSGMIAGLDSLTVHSITTLGA